MSEQAFAVDVQYGTFAVALGQWTGDDPTDIFQVFPAEEGHLIAWNSGVVTVSTGTRLGIVALRVRVHATPPAPPTLSGDDELEEVSVTPLGRAITIMGFDTSYEASDTLPSSASGNYRVRCIASGRAPDDEDPDESFLLEIWPTDAKEQAEAVGIRDVR